MKEFLEMITDPIPSDPTEAFFEVLARAGAVAMVFGLAILTAFTVALAVGAVPN